MWDYHVICIDKCNRLKKSFVYDYDSTLEFPVSFDEYAKKSLVVLENISKNYERSYRIITAKYYLENFASDRSHMIDKKTNEYIATPPSYSCIQTESIRKDFENKFFFLIFLIYFLESKNNLNEFMNMSLNENESQSHGLVLNEIHFREFFNKF